MNSIKQHQIFDNAFLSGCAWHKRLLVPLVNEIFHKNIPEGLYIEHLSNEQFQQGNDGNGKDKIVKRITDTLVRVDNGKYHFECESKKSGEILIRISEYDMQIAVNDATYEDYKVDMELPETAVIFLRNHRKLPKSGIITYHKGNQVLTHTVPFLEVGKLTIECLLERHLFLLFPFYLMRYEHAIKNTPAKYDMIERETKKVYDTLIKAYKDELISENECWNILTLCNDVVAEMSEDTDIRERLIEIMGTEVLQTAEERVVNKVNMEAIRNIMEQLNKTFDEACDILKIDLDKRYLYKA